jgi:hypothetical protein
MLKPLLTLALLLPTITHARIGETPEQCAKRYGEVFESKGNSSRGITSYGKDGVQTTCYFSEGKCVAIAFELSPPVRADLQDSEQNTVFFTPEQTAALLAANKGSAEWFSMPEHRGITKHLAKDGSRRAMTSGTHVIIQTEEDIEARKKRISSENVSKIIEGF